jgi:hypothetical protein
MSENTKNITQNGQNGQKNGNGSVGGNFEDVPILRLPFGMLMLSKNQETNGRTYEGTVGIKYGPEKSDWLRMSYLDMKKVIDFCKENKALFNTQLQQEREKMVVGDL